MKISKLAGLNALLAIALLGAACTPGAAPTPTLDPNVIYTAAAQTVVAQLTQNAPPPTNTPAPTQTQAPTATMMAALPTLPPLGAMVGLPSSTPSTSGDKCQYITQTPADNSSIKGGSTFNVIWRIKNIGTTTWNTQYVYRRYVAVSNELKTAASGYNMTATVAPNNEVELKLVATAPTTAGVYTTNWVLTNPQSQNFCAFNVTVNVTAGTSGGDSPTAKPPTEAEIITYDEDTINGIGGPAWLTVTIPHTSGDPIQARVIFRREPSYTGTITATGNNGVPQNGDFYYKSETTGTLNFGIEHNGSYDFKIDRSVAGERVLRVEVCVSSVKCW